MSDKSTYRQLLSIPFVKAFAFPGSPMCPVLNENAMQLELLYTSLEVNLGFEVKINNSPKRPEAVHMWIPFRVSESHTVPSGGN